MTDHLVYRAGLELLTPSSALSGCRRCWLRWQLKLSGNATCDWKLEDTIINFVKLKANLLTKWVTKAFNYLNVRKKKVV